MKQQQRFILALVASAAILIIWNYVFPPPKPSPNANANANANVQQAASPSASPSSPALATATPAPAQANTSPAPTPETVPERKLKIVTPLYDAIFDTRGAVATSWRIKRNKNTGREIFGASSTKNNPQPLELIPAPPPEIPADQLFRTFQITTGDAALDNALANRNYQAIGANAETGDETIELTTGSRQIDFVIHDEA